MISAESILTLIIGSIIGGVSTYYFQKRAFNREDNKKNPKHMELSIQYYLKQR